LSRSCDVPLRGWRLDAGAPACSHIQVSRILSAVRYDIRREDYEIRNLTVPSHLWPRAQSRHDSAIVADFLLPVVGAPLGSGCGHDVCSRAAFFPGQGTGLVLTGNPTRAEKADGPTGKTESALPTADSGFIQVLATGAVALIDRLVSQELGEIPRPRHRRSVGGERGGLLLLTAGNDG
jgi:hypothetical protein